jgi:uncharacterized protein (TIGR02118 family)
MTALMMIFAGAGDRAAAQRGIRAMLCAQAAALPGLAGLRLSCVTDSAQRIEARRDALTVDAFAEAWLANADHAHAASARPATAAAALPEGAALRTYFVEKRVIVGGPRTGVKRLATLRRRDDITHDRFRAHWTNVHGAMVARIPAVEHYAQHHVIAGTNSAAVREGDAVDGVVELWFADARSMTAAFSSADGLALARDLPAFVATVSTYLASEELLFGAAPG